MARRTGLGRFKSVYDNLISDLGLVASETPLLAVNCFTRIWRVSAGDTTKSSKPFPM
jgi:hypothetical protein